MQSLVPYTKPSYLVLKFSYLCSYTKCLRMSNPLRIGSDWLGGHAIYKAILRALNPFNVYPKTNGSSGLIPMPLFFSRVSYSKKCIDPTIFTTCISIWRCEIIKYLKTMDLSSTSGWHSISSLTLLPCCKHPFCILKHKRQSFHVNALWKRVSNILSHLKLNFKFKNHHSVWYLQFSW